MRGCGPNSVFFPARIGLGSDGVAKAIKHLSAAFLEQNPELRDYGAIRSQSCRRWVIFTMIQNNVSEKNGMMSAT